MRRSAAFFLILVVFGLPLAGHAKTDRFQTSGEVTSSDPIYGRLTVQHPAIQGFSDAAETEFSVRSKEALADIHKGDLVDFEILDKDGDVWVEKIKKTGVAPPRKEKGEIGRAVQDVLVATGEVAKGITTPLPPAHEVVKGTVSATTGATGSILGDAEGTEVKKKF